MSARYDLAVVGGGIMGCEAAHRAAAGGMRVVLLEQAGLGSGASGVNAGTLSMQIKRVALIPYALAGHAIWHQRAEQVGFKKTGGYTLAFTPAEAELLHTRMALKREAGAPIDMVDPASVAEREPDLQRQILAASWCSEDGYADPTRTGDFYRGLLREAGVETREHTEVTGIDPVTKTLCTAAGQVSARRILLAGGAWLRRLSAMGGSELPVNVRTNTVSVTERGPTLLRGVIGHATGLLTMKQKPNGTVLIGGGWQGIRDDATGRGRVSSETLIPNLQLAQFVVPALAGRRVVRSWTGFEANVPDFYPLAGALPGTDDIFVLGCVRGGYTIGPYIGRLMGDLILGREPERPLFDPARFSKISNRAGLAP